jgi:hypothetical protein
LHTACLPLLQGGSFANFICNVNRHRANGSRLIDWELILMMEPTTIAGSQLHQASEAVNRLEKMELHRAAAASLLSIVLSSGFVCKPF